MAFLYFARYSSLTKCAACLTLKGPLEGNRKSVIFWEYGGQQLRLGGVAPRGRSGGAHLDKSGGDIGEAREEGFMAKVLYIPPRPIRTFLLCSPILFSSSCSSLGLFWLLLLPLHVISWRFGLPCLEDWLCFCENGYKEEYEIFELEETLIVEIKERGDKDIMV